jgi:hypothetical protein
VRSCGLNLPLACTTLLALFIIALACFIILAQMTTSTPAVLPHLDQVKSLVEHVNRAHVRTSQSIEAEICQLLARVEALRQEQRSTPLPLFRAVRLPIAEGREECPAIRTFEDQCRLLDAMIACGIDLGVCSVVGLLLTACNPHYLFAEVGVAPPAWFAAKYPCPHHGVVPAVVETTIQVNVPPLIDLENDDLYWLVHFLYPTIVDSESEGGPRWSWVEQPQHVLMSGTVKLWVEQRPNQDIDILLTTASGVPLQAYRSSVTDYGGTNVSIEFQHGGAWWYAVYKNRVLVSCVAVEAPPVVISQRLGSLDIDDPTEQLLRQAAYNKPGRRRTA